MVSTDKGYIRIYRDIREHWIWGDSEALKAWIDLIMMANHTDQKVYFDNQLITVKRGTFITSIRHLAERWHWSRGRVSRFLDVLERDSMIATVRDTKKTSVTIENYRFYQPPKKQNGPQTEPLMEPQTRPQTGPQTEHSEIIKNTLRKNEEEEAPPRPLSAKPWWEIQEGD